MKKKTLLIISLSVFSMLIALVIHILTKNNGFEIGIFDDDFFKGFFVGLGITFPVLLIPGSDKD